MDFRQQPQPTSARPTVVAPAPVAPEHKEVKITPKKAGLSKFSEAIRIFSVLLFTGVAILLLGIAFVFSRSSSDNEFKYVTTGSNNYQAVFLNNGQVYFGNIDSLNNKYIQLTNVYYLTQSDTTATTSSNYSLAKLGCQQIHDPTDQMIINRDQVTFWENLQGSGKVVSSIKSYQSQIKGQTQAQICAQVSSQTQASNSSSTTQGTDTTTGTGTNTTGTGTNSSTTK